MMFKISDRVKCIDASKKSIRKAPPLIEGRDYIVYGIEKCGCGAVKLDVGISRQKEKLLYCCQCRKGRRTNVWWCDSKRFAKVEEKTAYKVIHSEIVVEEPVLS